jgi:SAM-dependent methyltransferase
MKQDHPAAEIAAGNPWYLADQHRSQLGSRGRRRVIEHRWRVFGEMVDEWRGRRASRDEVAVLDAGCGDGINLIGLRDLAAKRRLRLDLFGVDYNFLRLTRARGVDSRARVHQGSLYQLPFVSGSFDVVLCNHVLEHVPDLPAALANLRRVLRPGGLMIVGVPNEGCLMGRARNRVIQPSIGRSTDHVHFFTAKTLTAALTSAGLLVQRVDRETFFFPCSYLNAGCQRVCRRALADGRAAPAVPIPGRRTHRRRGIPGAQLR